MDWIGYIYFSCRTIVLLNNYSSLRHGKRGFPLKIYPKEPSFPEVLFKRIPVANWIELSYHPFSIWGYPIETQKALLSFASGSL